MRADAVRPLSGGLKRAPLLLAATLATAWGFSCIGASPSPPSATGWSGSPSAVSPAPPTARAPSVRTLSGYFPHAQVHHRCWTAYWDSVTLARCVDGSSVATFVP